jgi:hypothetical protein
MNPSETPRVDGPFRSVKHSQVAAYVLRGRYGDGSYLVRLVGWDNPNTHEFFQKTSSPNSHGPMLRWRTPTEPRSALRPGSYSLAPPVEPPLARSVPGEALLREGSAGDAVTASTPTSPTSWGRPAPRRSRPTVRRPPTRLSWRSRLAPPAGPRLVRVEGQILMSEESMTSANSSRASCPSSASSAASTFFPGSEIGGGDGPSRSASAVAKETRGRGRHLRAAREGWFPIAALP